jgi:hypothetical protein
MPGLGDAPTPTPHPSSHPGLVHCPQQSGLLQGRQPPTWQDASTVFLPTPPPNSCPGPLWLAARGLGNLRKKHRKKGSGSTLPRPLGTVRPNSGCRFSGLSSWCHSKPMGHSSHDRGYVARAHWDFIMAWPRQPFIFPFGVSPSLLVGLWKSRRFLGKTWGHSGRRGGYRFLRVPGGVQMSGSQSQEFSA